MNPAPSRPAVDPAQAHLVQELKHTRPLLGCRFDPSGRFVCAGAQDNAVVRWELAGAKKTLLAGHQSWVRALAFAPKERLLFTAGYEGKILVWLFDADKPAPLRSLEGHQGWVRALAISPDGQVLASCGNDHQVRLWSVRDGRLLHELSGHTCHVYNLAFHPGGRHLASADLKGLIKVWDLDRTVVERELDGSALYRYDPGFRGDGAVLACSGITEVHNAFAGVGKPLVLLFDWPAGKGRPLRLRENFQGTAWGVAFHPAGYVVAVGGGNGGMLWFWKDDRAPDSFALKLPANGRDLDLHPDGKRLAVAGADGVVRIYDLSPRKA
jgi:WD40 repeat protein